MLQKVLNRVTQFALDVEESMIETQYMCSSVSNRNILHASMGGGGSLRHAMQTAITSQQTSFQLALIEYSIASLLPQAFVLKYGIGMGCFANQVP